MNISDNTSAATKNNTFEFPGSTVHYTPFFNFKIIFMLLKIKPDFNLKTLIDCEQKITINVLQDLNEIELDVAEMRIEKGDINSSIVKIDNVKISEKDDKMKIQFDRLLNAGTVIDLNIKYSTGYFSKDNTVPTINSPRSGFHFISKDGSTPATQAWTQGETWESRYWFPCIDDPQVKYPREIHITVPSEEYIVISNGMSDDLQKKTAVLELDNNVKKIKWIWNEPNSNPAYLTSVVIGKFFKKNIDYDDGRILLQYFWPLDITESKAMLTFEETPNMIKFFEEYFETPYPYKKYSQVTVDDFEFGGMENTSCTTLTRNILHDEKVLPDYTSDIVVVAHELAHQWFGNLVTCKDWSNIWLNEGFASYSEALYWEESRKQNEFLFKVHQDMTGYFDEANKLYKRPIVTRIFKHPDELFDAHSYLKGSCVLHMLRYHIGNTCFKNSLKEYLSTYKNNNAETDDFRRICEKVSGKDLQQFFNQWLFTKGHPILEIEYSLSEDKNGKKIKIKIVQVQEEENPFLFSMNIRIIFTNECNNKDTENYQITGKIFEKEIDIPQGESIKYISIDPNLNLIKEIKSVKILEEKDDFQLKDILINQLKNGFTIIERIQAANILKSNYSDEIINVLKNVIMSGDFYGLLVEVANVFGSFNDKNNYSKMNSTYNNLIQCLDHSEILSSQVLRAVIRNIGAFERSESIPILLGYLQENEHFFIQSAAAAALGKSSKNIDEAHKSQKESMINELKKIVNGKSTFQNIVAKGAIDGLKEFSKDDDADLLIDIANFLIEKTSDNNDYYIRASATAALGKFLINDNKETRLDKDKSNSVKKMNQQVFDCLIKLSQDKRRRIKITACSSLADTDAKTSTLEPRLIHSIKFLVDVAEHDLDGFVRSHAERSASTIREWVKELASNPPKIDIKLREKVNFPYNPFSH
ncbi:MAG: M1 family metallopeptidase [Candidatus Nitrosocosmicus sp.]